MATSRHAAAQALAQRPDRAAGLDGGVGELMRRSFRWSGPKLAGSSWPSVNRCAQAAGVGHQHRQLVVAELAQLLPAAAAGRDRLAGRRRPPAPRCSRAPAGQHHRRQRPGLGAHALRVGRVLDVAAGVDAALLVEQRGADMEGSASTGA
jgi:hypothetical protein